MIKFNFTLVLIIQFLSNSLLSQEIIDINTKKPFSNPKYKIEKIIPLETRSDAFLSLRKKVVRYKDVFVVTDMDKIVIYNANGKINKVLNIKGRGVGESIDLEEFVVYDNHIYINNRYAKELIKYNISGDYINSCKYDDYFGDFEFIGDKIVADISNLQDSKDKQLAVLNKDNLNVENRYISTLSPGLGLADYQSIKRVNNDIYFIPAYSDIIYRYSKGETIEYINLIYTNKDAPTELEKKECRARKKGSSYSELFKLYREKKYIEHPRPTFNSTWFTMRYNQNDSPYMFIKNRKSGKDYLVDIKNEKDIIFTSYIQQESEDKFISLVEAHNFVENYKDAAKYGVTEDSNPVLLIWDFVE